MDCKKEVENRVNWIREILANAHSNGIVIGNSGGKDCTLVEILSKMATDNVLSVIMPCESKRNYKIDRDHALLVADKYGIKTIEVDITDAKLALKSVLVPIIGENVPMAYGNMNPRLRMTVLYTIAQTYNYLVAGTGNASERFMGYFTKWGDGAFDFNPIADLTVAEVYEMLEYLEAPREIIDKAPSAGLFDGQTDEDEMGVKYSDVDEYIKTGNCANQDKIIGVNKRTEHKRVASPIYKR